MTIKKFQTVLSRPERNEDPLLDAVRQIAKFEDPESAARDDTGRPLWTPWH